MKYTYIYFVFVIFIKVFYWRQQFIKLLRKTKNRIPRYRNNFHSCKRAMYTFRPFEITLVDYKSYGKSMKGRGINMFPKPRSGHRIVVNDTDIFCFGGFNPALRLGSEVTRTAYLFQEMWKFNLITQKWCKTFTQTADANRMPEELVSNAVIMRDDMMVVFGGTGFPFGRACSNKCYLFWPYSNPRQITLLETTGDKPDPQYGQAIMLRDTYLYAIGGTTGFEYSCDIYRLDLLKKVWESVYICRGSSPSEPKGRYRHEIAYDNNYIYVLGGGTSDSAFDLEIVPAFDLRLNKWISIKTQADPSVKLPGYPAPRKCHSCVQYETPNGIEVIIAGGYFEDQRFFDDIWKLNLRTHQWQLFQTTTFPRALYFHDAATSGNGKMYVFGGISVGEGLENSTRINDIYKIWTTIPKLSEIAWDAVIYYHPDLPNRERTELLELGIPPKFANRAIRGQTIFPDF